MARWGRRSRRGDEYSEQSSGYGTAFGTASEADSRMSTQQQRQRQQQQQQSYVPPVFSEDQSSTIGETGSASVAASTATASAASGGYYVTSPPPTARKSNLTGNISSLFRRSSSKERKAAAQRAAAARAVSSMRRNTEDPSSPSSAHPGAMPNHSSPRGRGRGSSTSSSRQHYSSALPPTTSHHQSRSNLVGRTARTQTQSRSRSRSRSRSQSQPKQRIFYSSHGDVSSSSEDSYESRAKESSLGDTAAGGGEASAASATGTATYTMDMGSSVATSTLGSRTTQTHTTGTHSTKTGQHSESSGGGASGGPEDDGIPTILRYRGFSTSIQSLFLDEGLVCASMGCFGLFLSNRTEYLLQLRNDRRGVRWGRSTSRRTLPSRIVAYALLLTIVLITITFVVWGFGNGEASSLAEGFYEGYDYQDDGWDAVGIDDDEYKEEDQDNQNQDDNDNDDNAQEQEEQEQEQDDQINNDDQAAQNNDDQAAQDDGYYNANNNNNNNNDDANNDDGKWWQYNQNNGDDAVGDDANYNNYNFNNYNDRNYDQNGNNYNYQNGNYYNGNNGNRYLDVKKSTNTSANANAKKTQLKLDQCPHAKRGIFKLRDANEAVWEPAIDFLKDEWYRGATTTKPTTSSRLVRSLEDGNGNAYSAYGDDYYNNMSEEAEARDLAADLRFSFVIFFLIVLGVLGRRRRMRTRYYLVRARAQEDHLFYASSGAGVKRVAFQDSREDQYEGACSHTLCGCYQVDPPMDGDEIDDDVKVDDTGVTQRKKTPYHHDCVSRAFSCLMACCCGLICRCWFQCLSICALAQEAREIRLLVPTRYQRVDYITHQPFNEYQKDVNDLRRGWMGKSRKKSGIAPHFKALSRLSRYILVSFLLVFLTIVGTLTFNPRASFSWPDAIILAATFVQSFAVIFIVFWIFHKSDLSLDAVIKFFAAGFLIAVPSAFFFEGLLVNITLTMAYSAYAIGDQISETFTIWIVDHYTWIWVAAEFINAYLVAAVTEELCKYYTFRCIEHPDLIFLTGLARSSEDSRTVAGGMVKYPFGSHQVQETNRRDDYDDDEVSVSSRSSHRSMPNRPISNRGVLDLDNLDDDDEFEEDENDVRTHRQKAAAVTTAMISVAVGLACAENFLYVFILGGAASNSGDVHSGGVIEEWIVLLFRSLFPVHALAAAMQSINMIRKFVECDDDNSHRVGVGRIVLPAIIMHGSFDAVLLAINVYIENAWDQYLQANEGNFDPENPPYNPIIVNLVAWLSIIGIMVAGTFWYFRQNRLQRQRLIALEEQEKSNLDSEMRYRIPDVPPPKNSKPSEVELV